MHNESSTNPGDIPVRSKFKLPRAAKRAARPRRPISLSRALALVLLLPVILTLTGPDLGPKIKSVAAAVSIPAVPTQSSPIALAQNQQFLVNVNPDSDTLTVFVPNNGRNGGNLPVKLAEIPVGDRPTSVAVTPDSRTAYVANGND